MNIKDAKKFYHFLSRRMFSLRFKLDLHIVGSLRRERPLIKDIDVLIVVDKFDNRIMSSILFSGIKNIKLVSMGTRKTSLIVSWKQKAIKVDIFIASKDELPFALFHLTGSKMYNIRIRRLAKRKGLKLNQYGIFNINTGKKAPRSKSINTEKKLAKYLGVSYRLPRDREK
jgi:DNA polymerase (family 10)